MTTPKGTVDILSDEYRERKQIIDSAIKWFEIYGADPIDTPVFELQSVLKSKYGDEEKLIYDLADQGGQLLSLRYDLTVPFARFLSNTQISNMRRYQIGKVYRRDNVSRETGRMREFTQMDFDIAGGATYIADTEIIQMIINILDELKITDYTIRINDREFLINTIKKYIPEINPLSVASSLDKLDKISWDEVSDELVSKGALIDSVICLEDALVDLIDQPPKNISDIFKIINSDNIKFDPTLARGLNYYTGIIFEVIAENNHGNNTTFAAGGRYDNLVSTFNKNKSLPIVGVSFGLERLMTLKNDRPGVVNQQMIYVAIITNDVAIINFGLAYIEQMRKTGRRVMMGKLAMATKKALHAALLQKATHFVVIGNEEFNTKNIIIKELTY